MGVMCGKEKLGTKTNRGVGESVGSISTRGGTKDSGPEKQGPAGTKRGPTG